MKRFVSAVVITGLAMVGTSACATKKMVRQRVGEVDQKVDTLSRSVEETQQRTRANEGRIGEVDQKAAAAGQAAQDAATTANTNAQAAGSAAKEAANSANTANTKADTIDRNTKKLVYEVVLSEDQGNFKFAKTELPDEAKARLDQMITQLKADPKGAYFEIEGHTDNTGSTMTNEKLGLERAEAVKRYLYQQHQIPLHKMNVISYGEDKPVAPNKTRDGRAQNRRVVIRVLT